LALQIKVALDATQPNPAPDTGVVTVTDKGTPVCAYHPYVWTEWLPCQGLRLSAGQHVLTLAYHDEGGTHQPSSTSVTITVLPAPNASVTSLGVTDGVSCAARRDTGVTCWGASSVARPPADQLYRALSLGQRHGCGLKADGTLGCWGSNLAGEASPPAGTFSAVDVGKPVTLLDTGRSFSCGLRSDQSLACWGDNTSGQATPPTGAFTSLSVGSRGGCAVRTDRSLACWGIISSSLLPAGQYQSVEVAPLSNVAAACGIRMDSTLSCAGWPGGWTTPAGTFRSLSTGSGMTCALSTNGSAVCWGRYGVVPTPAFSFLAVKAAGWTACGLKADGGVECWGSPGNQAGPELTVPLGFTTP
jgi:hypothetical protein